MAIRSAMKGFLIVAVTLLAVAYTASAADNSVATAYAKVDIKLKGVASDYLQISKRNQFCTSFSATLTAAKNDLASCVINSAVNSDVVGEVTVTASFTFAAARTPAEVATTLNNALNSGTPPAGFEKAAAQTSPAAASATQGTFPSYFAEVEIVFTTDLTDANVAGYAAALKTALALPASDTTAAVNCGTTRTQITAAATGTAGSKITCQITSLSKTPSELVTLVKQKTTAATGINDGVAARVAVYARDTGLLAPAAKYVITLKALIGGTDATTLTTNFPNLRSALQRELAVTTALDATNAANQGATGATADISITVASERDANRVLETLKQLVSNNISATGTTVNFPITSITSLTIVPGLFSDAGTVYPDRVFRYDVVISNTTSAFTSAPFQFRRVCESITASLQGNASSCAILEFNRPTGDAGTLSVEITATNNSAALSLSRNVVRAFGAIPVTTFALGAVTEVIPFPGQITGGTVQVTLQTPYTTVDSVTPTVREALCAQLVLAGTTNTPATTSGYVPGLNLVNCFITDADVVAGTAAGTVVVTARVWWRISSFSLADYVAAVKQALTNKAFSAAPTDFNTVITGIAAGSATTTFAFDADFHITTTSTDFAVLATQKAFTTAVAAVAGNSAVVAVLKSVAATGLNPSTGTLVTVRVFTPTAAAQAAAYVALAAQVAGNSTTIGSSTAFTIQPIGFRRVTFFPGVLSSEFPAVPPPPPPATPPARPATPPATPPPGLPPQGPVVVGTDSTRDPNSSSATFVIEFAGSGTEAQFNTNIEALKTGANAIGAGIISHTTTGFTTFGKKFVVQNYRGTVTFVTSSPSNAAVLNTRLATAINNGAIPNARVVSVTPASNPAAPATPAAPAAPTAPAAPVAMTTGTIDIIILGTRSSFTATDQTALTSNVGSAINGTASVVGVTETSTNARKFTMQASALRVATLVSAPAAQYPTVDSIIARLLAVRANQNGRLGNSSVFSITTATGSAAARSGPVALTILVALLIAVLSAMAQF